MKKFSKLLQDVRLNNLLEDLMAYHKKAKLPFKVHIFWEGHKILRNLYIGQIYCGDLENFCGLLRIYEL